MIVAKIADSKNDEYYTPSYAIEPLLKYLKPNSIIWCPFDLEISNFVKILRQAGHKVVATHILNGNDFFNAEFVSCDYIISNPPYTLKGKVLERLFALNIPFAMLVGVVGIFESQHRFNLFKNNKFEVMYFNLRVSYFKDYGNQKEQVNPPYSSVFICSNILPQQIVFETIIKSKSIERGEK